MKTLSQEGPTFAAIVGAPRCGTTSLARYLREHPDICFSAVKEPHFFSQHDLSGMDDTQLFAKVEQDYLARYFPDAKPGAMLMEGSVTYLYAPSQIAVVLRLWPEAKFIIAVRDPFAMLPSLHQRLLLLGDETVTDFAKAWALAPARAQGKHVPRTCVDPRWLQYPEIGRLGKHVEQFFAAVGRERCLVVVLDDLIADPAAIYREVLDFLGLAHDERSDFPRHRASLGFKIGWLQRLLKRPPVITRSVLAGENFRLRLKAVDKTGPDHWFIRSLLRWHEQLLNWNEVPARAAVLSPAMQEEIRSTLSDDVQLLAQLLRRDLSQWLGGLPAAGSTRPSQPQAIPVSA